MRSKTQDKRAETLQTCITDAFAKFAGLTRESQLEVTQWDQMFPNTSCGFGGIAGNAFTSGIVTVIGIAESVVLETPTNAVLVYVNGRFAYVVDSPNTKFREDMANFRLIEKRHYQEQYEEEKENEEVPQTDDTTPETGD